MDSSLAETIRRRRGQLQLSQGNAARKAGISRHAWSKIEVGRSQGSEITMAKIESVLQMSPGSLSDLRTKKPVDDLTEIRNDLIAMIKVMRLAELKQALIIVLQIQYDSAMELLRRYNLEAGAQESVTSPICPTCGQPNMLPRLQPGEQRQLMPGT